MCIYSFINTYLYFYLKQYSELSLEKKWVTKPHRKSHNPILPETEMISQHDS